MTILESLQKTKQILIPQNPLPVEQTSSLLLQKTILGECTVNSDPSRIDDQSVLKVAVSNNASFSIGKVGDRAPSEKQWAYIRIGADGSGELIVSFPSLLYAYISKFIEEWLKLPVSTLESGKYFTTAFRWHRPLYDYLLTQTWRSARHFDTEEHIEELARSGYTHFEVNGLAASRPLEESVEGEFYAPFYSYCVALDQYVSSNLNEGIYPPDYLNGNLQLINRYADLGQRYGLQPGILCYEPRSVPERFFQKYPTLRGARVDHPYRSRLPRYSLALAHPLVQQHYREMITKLLREVPDLAYMSIWSNDSGAGFEYTSSLYVGRNGGPYLIREWRSHEQIAEVAGKNVVNFMKLLQDAAIEINPNFRVSLRLEPFKEEHDVIVENLEEGLDIEVPSLLVRGYDLPYQHPKYSDVTGIAGSIHHTKLDQKESEFINQYQVKGIYPNFIYSQGNGFNLEPLLGIPFPGMVYEKLQAMKQSGVEYAANLGGFTPSSLVPFHINQEVFRQFMLDPHRSISDVIREKATEWAGKQHSDQLIRIWQFTEEAIRWLPPLPLYSHFGFVWLRVWVRPLVPDLHAIPEHARRYYEDYMVSSNNNTNLADLGRDVLFQLFDQNYGQQFVERVDANVLGKTADATDLTNECINDLSNEEALKLFIDQRDRLIALKCWIKTLRSVAAWVAGVYGYLESADSESKSKWRSYLYGMMDMEIQNCKDLLELWNTSCVNFMVVSKTGENSFIYGENFGELLQRKIELMEKYKHVEPRIDKNIMWKV